MTRKLSNTYKKITEERQLTVVYFGGSVTAGACASDPDKTSWRALTGKYLKEKYPDVQVNNVSAAIGGTGTGFGLFRIENDVLSYNPDLVFIEFSINDAYQRYTVEESLIYYESIIRKIYSSNPYTDIIIAFITDRNIVYNGSRFIDAHKALAAHYDIPTISFNDALARELKDSQNPIDYYIKDWVHPNDNGYKLYAKTAIEFLENDLSGAHEKAAAARLPQPYSENLILDKTYRIGLRDMKDIEADGFLLEDGEFAAKELYNCYKKGDELRFTFTGTYIGAQAHSWKDEEATTRLVCIVDGKQAGVASFGKNDHSIIHVTFARGLPYGEHSVILRNEEDGKATIREFFVS